MSLRVLASGPLSTVQDLGRPGLSGIGIGASGAADLDAFGLANRLVGNDEAAAAVEVTLGGLVVRATRGLTVAVTGAPCPVTVDDRATAANSVLRVPAGSELRLGVPERGLRSYLAVRGGISVDPVLGSRSTDVLSGLGPAPLEAGQELPVGAAPQRFPCLDQAPVGHYPAEEVVLRVQPGPRADWFTAEAMETLLGSAYEVTAESNRVGMRLDGPPLERARTEELPSEGMVTGALQVPPAARPTLFLADHPVTGGYPVIAVVARSDVPKAAQARPGQRVRFRRR